MPEVIADVSMSDPEITLDVVHDFDLQMHRITIEIPNDLVGKIGVLTCPRLVSPLRIGPVSLALDLLSDGIRRIGQ